MEFPKTLPRFLSLFGLGPDFGPVPDSFLLSAAQGLRIRVLGQRVFQSFPGMRRSLGSVQGSACAVPRCGPYGAQRASVPVHLGNYESFRQSLEQPELDSWKDNLGNGTGSEDRAARSSGWLSCPLCLLRNSLGTKS